MSETPRVKLKEALTVRVTPLQAAHWRMRTTLSFHGLSFILFILVPTMRLHDD